MSDPKKGGHGGPPLQFLLHFFCDFCAFLWLEFRNALQRLQYLERPGQSSVLRALTL